MNFKNEFNKRAREENWDKYESKMKEMFKYTLLRLKDIDKYYIPNNLFPDNVLKTRIYRLDIGYNGVSRPNGIYSKIYTEKTIDLKSNQCTYDHLLGATQIGERVHKVFKENNYDCELMIDEWLYENLFLWGTIRVTKDEHKSYNILRDQNLSIEEKLEFKHYKKVSPRL